VFLAFTYTYNILGQLPSLINDSKKCRPSEFSPQRNAQKLNNIIGELRLDKNI
jgi:hypothetical protein